MMKHFNTDKELIENIKKFNLQMIMAATLKEICTNEYNNTLEQLEKQKKRYNVYKNESFKLSALFEEKKIKLIHLKGISLAADLYVPIESRKSVDIDLLVKYEDVKSCNIE